MSFIIKNRDDYDKLERYKKSKEKLFEIDYKKNLAIKVFIMI